MKRAALYLRVSTLDQHPETQMYDLRGLAAQRGFDIVQQYTDKISGTKAQRPGLTQLLADARRGKFDVVPVASVNRSTRPAHSAGPSLQVDRVALLRDRENGKSRISSS